MPLRELEQGVAWFAKHFYSLPSVFDRLFLKSRVGLWWNVPRNLGYRLALLWRDGVYFQDLITGSSQLNFGESIHWENTGNL